ncbi:MAG: homocysteine biosynthesis protein [Methermicoccaceae archaeon]
MGEINQKIKEGNVRVVDASEMPAIVEELGPTGATREVDVVTTGTFGAMCSSGIFFNLGHSDPPIKISRMWLNNVEAYAGLAAVDGYLGAAQPSISHGIEYGGAHVIEDLIAGKSVELRAEGTGTDCYPSRHMTTEVMLKDMNEVIMLNPRNAYRRYNAATNSTERTLYTYMGTLLPEYGNITYSGAGTISPINNDPTFRTIGIGTRIFLGGSQGYVVGNGTQHDPENNFSTLMVKGDLKEMSTDWIRASVFKGYGASLYVGIGIPIPVLNEEIATSCAVMDSEIKTNVLDYGVGRLNRPVLRQVSYEELKSGSVELFGEEVPCSSISSLRRAKEIAYTLSQWIKEGKFYLSEAVTPISHTGSVKPMRMSRPKISVSQIMSRNVFVGKVEDSMESAARTLINRQSNHLPVISDDGKLVGIVTSWDISKAVATGRTKDKIGDIMTTKVVSVSEDEPVEMVAHKLKNNNISAVPVIDSERKIIGIVTSEDISRLLAKNNRRGGATYETDA